MASIAKNNNQLIVSNEFRSLSHHSIWKKNNNLQSELKNKATLSELIVQIPMINQLDRLGEESKTDEEEVKRLRQIVQCEFENYQLMLRQTRNYPARYANVKAQVFKPMLEYWAEVSSNKAQTSVEGELERLKNILSNMVTRYEVRLHQARNDLVRQVSIKSRVSREFLKYCEELGSDQIRVNEEHVKCIENEKKEKVKRDNIVQHFKDRIQEEIFSSQRKPDDDAKSAPAFLIDPQRAEMVHKLSATTGIAEPTVEIYVECAKCRCSVPVLKLYIVCRVGNVVQRGCLDCALRNVAELTCASMRKKWAPYGKKTDDELEAIMFARRGADWKVDFLASDEAAEV